MRSGTAWIYRRPGRASSRIGLALHDAVRATALEILIIANLGATLYALHRRIVAMGSGTAWLYRRPGRASSRIGLTLHDAVRAATLEILIIANLGTPLYALHRRIIAVRSSITFFGNNPLGALRFCIDFAHHDGALAALFIIGLTGDWALFAGVFARRGRLTGIFLLYGFTFAAKTAN